jgi:hypothetical protein
MYIAHQDRTVELLYMYVAHRDKTVELLYRYVSHQDRTVELLYMNVTHVSFSMCWADFLSYRNPPVDFNFAYDTLLTAFSKRFLLNRIFLAAVITLLSSGFMKAALVGLLQRNVSPLADCT